jgi:hypothetical protein
MTPHEWRLLRARVQQRSPNAGRCGCSRRCLANSLDEQWEYVEDRHLKRFLGARLLCPGCHWLASRTRRIETWHALKACRRSHVIRPHLVECLGWTKRQVNALRKQDLADYSAELRELAQIETAVLTGEASAMPCAVDLSALSQYGYRDGEVRDLERRMLDQAQDRLPAARGPMPCAS